MIPHQKPQQEVLDRLDRNINIVLFIAIVLAACLAVYTSLNVMKITGPTSIARSQEGSLVVALHDRFFILHSDGTTLDQRAFGLLGIDGLVNDIQSLSNGDLVIGDGGSRRLYRCDARLRLCQPLQGSNADTGYDVGKYHKFYIDEEQQHIILSNTERHELAMLDMDGSLKTTLIPKSGPLGFPDGIAGNGENRFLLANATKKQLLSITINNGKAETGRTYDIESNYTVNGRTLPMTVDRVSADQWWVTAQASSLSGIGSSLLRFDNTLKPIDRITHHGFVHPVDILDTGSLVLVPDMHAYRVFAMAHNGNNISEFGDSYFNNVLQDHKTAKQLNTWLRWFSIAALVVILGVALYLENARKQEKQGQEKRTAAESPAGRIKLEISESVPRMLRLMPVILLLLFGSSTFLLFGSMPEFVTAAMAPLLLLLLISMIALSMIARHIPKTIEINAGNISITAANDSVFKDTIENIAYTDHALCIGDEYFNIGRHGALITDKTGYGKMKILLKKAEKLALWPFMKRTFRKDAIANILIIVLFISLLAIQFITPIGDDTTKELDVIKEVATS